MFYSTLLSITLAATADCLGVRHRTSIPLSSRLGLRLGGGGLISDSLSGKGLLNKLPLTGPAVDRIPVPGRPTWSGENNSATSPEYPYLFTAPLPIPDIAQPLFTETVNGVPIDYYELTIEDFDTQLFPDRGPTTLIGYNGTVPGPTFMVEEGRETVVRVLNHGKRTATMHLHGMSTHAVWDGWAAGELEVGQWKDYYYPNNEGARSIWYHDHAEHHTAADAFEGQAGVYIVYDPKEDSLGLPRGKYDVPLALSDKTYQDNGQLVSLEGITTNFVGEMIHVNEQPWPYLEVEPRKYRFRIYDMSVSRPYDLYIVDDDGNWIDFQVIASDSGLFGHPVTTNDLTIAMGERYEIVVDFAGFSGRNLTFANKMQNPAIKDYENTDKVMRFVVGSRITDSSNNGPVPEALNSNLQFPKKDNITEVDRVFNFQVGGAAEWTINGVGYSDPNSRVLARPPQGTVELWELRHTGGAGVHPVHLHLVNLQVVSRSGGPRGLLPYETAGLKDTVFLQPGEVVHVLAYYGPWNGLYMFHCHNLIHEDHEMMAAFNVTLLTELGYDFESTQGFDDPDGDKYTAVEFSANAYENGAKHSAVRSLGSLNAYQPASSMIAAQASYYAKHGNKHIPATAVVTQTRSVAPSSVGEFFSTSVTSEALPGFEALETINVLDGLGLRKGLAPSNMPGLSNGAGLSNGPGLNLGLGLSGGAGLSNGLGLGNLIPRDVASPTSVWQTLARPTPSPETTVAPSRQ